jgi:hypothetical protein
MHARAKRNIWSPRASNIKWLREDYKMYVIASK